MGAMIMALALASSGASATPNPGPRAEQLGRQLAEAGTLGGLLPLIGAKETEELVAAHSELAEADKAALRRTAARVFEAGRARLMAAMGHAYAQRLSIADLRVLVAANRAPAAARYRTAQPGAIAAAMQSMSGMDFKGDAIAAFCRETGKACPPPR
jgi:hypothetical protein